MCVIQIICFPVQVVNMPAITDNEAMITISTDDGANWVVMSKEAENRAMAKAEPDLDHADSVGQRGGGGVVKVKRSFAGPRLPQWITFEFSGLFSLL